MESCAINTNIFLKAEVGLPYSAMNIFLIISSYSVSQWLGLSVLHSTVPFFCPALYVLSYCSEENECI